MIWRGQFLGSEWTILLGTVVYDGAANTEDWFINTSLYLGF